ncbi:CBS domain-containing protein [Streptomyces sp. AB3(2024)]|uniref:CBS domain-containing protein n=1 Tax=Streptomyces sp. AB3(2024) TaxID=3317321 RepID=UPI0035A3CCB5
MRHREVSELMTREVVTVPQNAAFKDIVRTLLEHHVSAVPVVDTAGHALGLISEGDLLPKSAAQGDHFQSLPEREAWQEDKAAGLRAEELTSAPPVCARPDWTVAEAAITVDVTDGRVQLHGTVQFKSLIPVIERLCRTVDGVVSVKEQLGFAVDDTLAP